MKVITKKIKQSLTLICLASATVSFNSAIANSDMKAMGEVQKAREMARHQGKHVRHFKPIDEKQKFRGVYYGYLPCAHCAGIKLTLSLKNRSNYLLVTQYAQASIKEYYDKGKYTWDDKTGLVTLVSKKDAKETKLRIKSDSKLIMLNEKGNQMKGDQDQYKLVRSDKQKSRQVHIH